MVVANRPLRRTGGVWMHIGYCLAVVVFSLCNVAAVSVHASDADARKQASKLRAEGDALLVSGDAQGALSKYAQAIELEPNEVKNYLKSYRANDRLKRVQASLRDLNLAIEKDVEQKELLNSLLLRGRIYTSLGRCFEAVQDWNRMLEMNPNHAEATDGRNRAQQCSDLLKEAETKIATGDWDNAERFLTEAIDVLRSAAPDLRKKRARARYHKGDHYECIADAGEVVKMDRNDVDTLTLRGQAYYELGEMDVALRHAQEALQSDPEFSAAKALHKTVNGIRRMNAAALGLMEKRQWKDAREKFEQLVRSFNVPREVGKNVYLNTCKCANELKDRAGVHRACQKSFELDDNWIESKIAYAEMLAATSDGPEEWEETVRAWKNALNMDQNNGRIHDGLRRAEAALKQSKTKNYYKILGVARNADLQTIKKAYRELAKMFHPDKNRGLDEEEMKTMQKRFADVAEAYEVLSDDEKRGKYDRGEDVFENQGGGYDPHAHFRRRRGGFHWNFNF